MCSSLTLGLCQQRTDFGNLGDIVSLIARLFTHFSVDSSNVGIRWFTYQIHRLIRLTPFGVVLLYVGPTQKCVEGGSSVAM